MSNDAIITLTCISISLPKLFSSAITMPTFQSHCLGLLITVFILLTPIHSTWKLIITSYKFDTTLPFDCHSFHTGFYPSLTIAIRLPVGHLASLTFSSSNLSRKPVLCQSSWSTAVITLIPCSAIKPGVSIWHVPGFVLQFQSRFQILGNVHSWVPITHSGPLHLIHSSLF